MKMFMCVCDDLDVPHFHGDSTILWGVKVGRTVGVALSEDRR